MGGQRKSGGGRQEYRFPPKNENFSLFSQSFAPWSKRLWNLPPYPDGVSQYSLAFAGEYWETLSKGKRAADGRLAICGLKKVMYVWRGLQRPGGGSKGSECHPHPLFLSYYWGWSGAGISTKSANKRRAERLTPPALHSCRGAVQFVPCKKQINLLLHRYAHLFHVPFELFFP